MPKRVIDGEGIWTSDKIGQVQPSQFRAEFTNLLPLALANGVFEVNPRRVWSKVYAFNRDNITPEVVEAILTEFVRVRLLFRWRTPDGKEWGYWTGIDKPGRLPGKSRRGKNEAVGPDPPADALRKFMVSNAIRNETIEQLNGTDLHLGSGSGLGSGLGSGITPSPNPGKSDHEANSNKILPTRSQSQNLTARSKVNGQPIPASDRVAALLMAEILRNKPDFKTSSKQLFEWQREADRMIRIDNRSEERIAAVIRWAHADRFWKTTALSMDSIRKNFDQLELKARTSKGEPGSNKQKVHGVGADRNLERYTKGLSGAIVVESEEKAQ